MLSFYSTGLVRDFNMLMCFVNLQWRAVAYSLFQISGLSGLIFHGTWFG